MSQAKVDKYKQEKYNRKNTPKKTNVRAKITEACIIVVLAVAVVYLGYSIAVETGLYTPKSQQETFVGTATAEELESQLQSYDPVGFYSEAKENNAEEETTVADEKSEEAATEAE